MPPPPNPSSHDPVLVTPLHADLPAICPSAADVVLTQPETVMAAMPPREAMLPIVTYWLVPLNVSALLMWPAPQVGALTSVPLLEAWESAAVVPLVSSSFHQATNPLL